MKRIRVEAKQGLDEQGDPEMFTFDLFALIPSEQTLHLDENGLPKIGTRIMPGMIIIGKSGQSRRYVHMRKPSSIEATYMNFEELREQFGAMWALSAYATPETSGVVVAAHLSADGLTATVEIEREE